MQITILIAVLLLVLLYLHIKSDPLIFQKNIKIAGILTIIALVMQGISACVSFVFILNSSSSIDRFEIPDNAESIIFFAALFVIANWILIITAYFNLIYGCRAAAFFKITESEDPLLRKKVSDILMDASETKKVTRQLKMFLDVKHHDPLVEDIRSKCGGLKYYENQIVPLKEWGKLKQFAEELKE